MSDLPRLLLMAPLEPKVRHGDQDMSKNQNSIAALPLEWDKEWSRDKMQTSANDIEAHYDRGGIVLKTKLVGGDELPQITYCYPDGLIEYLEEIQRAGALFNATAFLEDISGDIARGGLERAHALLRLMAYTLSQPSSLTENIWKHVGVKDQKFLISHNGPGLPDELCELMQTIAAEHSEAALATGDKPAEADQTDKRAPLFVEDTKGVRLVDKWWIDRGLALQNGTLKSAVKRFLPETVEELEIINAERAKDGLPPTSKEDWLEYGNKVARQLGLMPQIH